MPPTTSLTSAADTVEAAAAASGEGGGGGCIGCEELQVLRVQRAEEAERRGPSARQLERKAVAEHELEQRRQPKRRSGCGTAPPTDVEVEQLFARRRERAERDLVPTQDRPRLSVHIHYHVLYTKSDKNSNVPMSKIRFTHEQINRDFTQVNADLSQVPTTGKYAFADRAGCANIEFLPANSAELREPDHVSRVDVSDVQLLFPFRRLNVISPPRQGALNIYVVPKGPGGVTGTSALRSIQVWVDYRVLGNEENLPILSASIGRGTVTHEIGHAFGLFHTFDSTCSRSLYGDMPRSRNSNWVAKLFFNDTTQEWDGRHCNYDLSQEPLRTRHPSTQVVGDKSSWSCGLGYEMFFNFMDYNQNTRMFTGLQAEDMYDYVSSSLFLYQPPPAFAPPLVPVTDPLGVRPLQHFRPYKLVNVATGQELRADAATAAAAATSWVGSGAGTAFFLTGSQGENGGTRALQSGETVLVRDAARDHTLYHDQAADRSFFSSKTFLPLLPLTLESSDTVLTTNSILRLRTFVNERFMYVDERAADAALTVRGTADFYCRFLTGGADQQIDTTVVTIPEPMAPTIIPREQPAVPLNYEQPYLLVNRKDGRELSSSGGKDIAWAAAGNGSLWFMTATNQSGPIPNGAAVFAVDNGSRRAIGAWNSTLFFVPSTNGMVFFLESSAVSRGQPLQTGHGLRLRAFNNSGYLRRKLGTTQERAHLAMKSGDKAEADADAFDLELRVPEQKLPEPPLPPAASPDTPPTTAVASAIAYDQAVRLIHRTSGRELTFGGDGGVGDGVVRLGDANQGRALVLSAIGAKDNILQGAVVFINDQASGQQMGGTTEGMYFIPPIAMVYFVEGQNKGAPLQSNTPVRLKVFGFDDTYVNAANGDAFALGPNAGYDFRLAPSVEPVAPEVPGLALNYNESYLLIENDSLLELSDAGGKSAHLTSPGQGMPVYLRAEGGTGGVFHDAPVWISSSVSGYQLAREPALSGSTTATATATTTTMRFDLPGRGAVFVAETDTSDTERYVSGQALNTGQLLRFREAFTTDRFLSVNASKRVVISADPTYRFRMVPNLKEATLPPLLREGEVTASRTSRGSSNAIIVAVVVAVSVLVAVAVFYAMYAVYRKRQRRRRRAAGIGE